MFGPMFHFALVLLNTSHNLFVQETSVDLFQEKKIIKMRLGIRVRRDESLDRRRTFDEGNVFGNVELKSLDPKEFSGLGEPNETLVGSSGDTQ